MVRRLHHQDNHASNAAVEEVIYLAEDVGLPEIFFSGDKPVEAYNSICNQS